MIQQLPRYGARALSMALHPLILPLYLLAMLFTQTAFSLFPNGAKWYLGGAVILYGVVIPMVSVALLRWKGLLKDWKLHTRKERILPLLVGAVSYFVCAIVIARVPQADFLRKFVLAAACCELMCLLVSLEWKISLHLTGMGAAVALLVVLNILGLSQLFPMLLMTILAAGLLASARLYLGYHNIWQVLAGFFGGFLLMWEVLMWL